MYKGEDAMDSFSVKARSRVKAPKTEEVDNLAGRILCI
jgi:hypothetical protein